MPKSRASQLIDAMKEQRFVRISRRFEDAPVRGYVLDVGPRFFLLALVDDRLWFDGFECLRIVDVKRLKRDPYTAFAEAALRIREERMPSRPDVSLESIDELLGSASRAFPLITIHREKVAPDICHIGSVVAVKRGRVSLLEIRPDATWANEPSKYRLKEITRVNFGGDYEDALHIVSQAEA